MKDMTDEEKAATFLGKPGTMKQLLVARAVELYDKSHRRAVRPSCA